MYGDGGNDCFRYTDGVGASSSSEFLYGGSGSDRIQVQGGFTFDFDGFMRQLRKLDPTARRRIQAAIELLADQPRPSGARNSSVGTEPGRTGDYRIVDEIRDEVLLVLVVAVGHRRDIYQRR